MFGFLKKSEDKKEKEGDEKGTKDVTSRDSVKSLNTNINSTDSSNSSKSSGGNSKSNHNRNSNSNINSSKDIVSQTAVVPATNISSNGSLLSTSLSEKSKVADKNAILRRTFCESERVPIYPFSNQIQLLREIETQRVEWKKFLEVNPINVKNTWLWQYWDPQHRIRNQLKKKVLSIFDSKIRTQSHLKRLLRAGVPPEIRGRVWYCCSGADAIRAAAAPEQQYDALLLRIHELENTVVGADINKDLPRTFPTNSWLHGKDKDAKKFNVNTIDPKDGVYSLRNILYAYAIRNPKIGYCQSMNYIAALLLMHMKDDDAYWVLVALIENITYPDYYSPSMMGCRVDNFVLNHLISKKVPQINKILAERQATLDPVVCPWFLCLFINSLPIYAVCRMWDCLFWEGNSVLFRVSMAILINRKQAILNCPDAMTLYAAMRQGPGDYKVGNLALKPYIFSQSLALDDDANSDADDDNNNDSRSSKDKIEFSITSPSSSLSHKLPGTDDELKEVEAGPWYPGKYWHISLAKRSFQNLGGSPQELDRLESHNSGRDPPELLEERSVDHPSYSTELINTMYTKNVVGEISRQNLVKMRQTFLGLLEDSDEKLTKQRLALEQSRVQARLPSSPKKEMGGAAVSLPLLSSSTSSTAVTSFASSDTSKASKESASTSASLPRRPSHSDILDQSLGYEQLSREYLSDQFALSQLINASFEKVSMTMDMNNSPEGDDGDGEDDGDFEDASDHDPSASDVSTPVKNETVNHVDNLDSKAKAAAGKSLGPSSSSSVENHSGGDKSNGSSGTNLPQHWRRAFSLTSSDVSGDLGDDTKGVVTASLPKHSPKDAAYQIIDLWRSPSINPSTHMNPSAYSNPSSSVNPSSYVNILYPSYPLSKFTSYRSNRGRVAGFVMLEIVTSDTAATRERSDSSRHDISCIKFEDIANWQMRFVVIENRMVYVYTDEQMDTEVYRMNFTKGDHDIESASDFQYPYSFAIKKSKYEDLRPIKLISFKIALPDFYHLELWMMTVVNAIEGKFRVEEDFSADVLKSQGDSLIVSHKRHSEPKIGHFSVRIGANMKHVLDFDGFHKLAKTGDPSQVLKDKDSSINPFDYHKMKVEVNSGLLTIYDDITELESAGNSSKLFEESMESLLISMSSESIISYVLDEPSFFFCLCVSRVTFQRYTNRDNSISISREKRAPKPVIGSIRIGFDSEAELVSWNDALSAHLQDLELHV